MTHEELQLILTPEVTAAIRDNMEREPSAIALDKRVPHASVVATQVKYLQRARKKLPRHYAAQAIIPPIAFEQSSSQACAATKRYRGQLAIDLTCGLGVDALALSEGFERVVAIERDPLRAEVARINFDRLGATNIEVCCCSAAEFMEQFEGMADLIYADPDRREEGRRIVRPEECSPDVVAMMPLLKGKGRLIVIKNSPLLDVDEAFRIFGTEATVEALSAGGECKEVVVSLGEGIDSPRRVATAVGLGSYIHEGLVGQTTEIENAQSHQWNYLCIPDVSLRKVRTAIDYCHSRKEAIDIFGNESYGYSEELPIDFMGRTLRIVRMLPYKPKELRRILPKRVEIYRQNFPRSTAEICRALGISEGGTSRWAFTTAAGKEWAIELESIQNSLLKAKGE